MALENVLIYNFASGDSTYPHFGSFTIGTAGKITVDDSNGSGDNLFGDFTHTGGGDVSDQNVTESTVPAIDVGDTVDLRYKYTITGSDGSNNTIYFIATNNTADYGPLFASDAQLDPSVTYTFNTFNTDGAVAYSSLVPCFTAGTRIATPAGDRLIDDLRAGDRVLTQDDGFQPIHWICRTTVPAIGPKAPVLIKAGALGNGSDLWVSPNHRMLVADRMSDLYFGEREVLVAAKHLAKHEGVSIVSGGVVTYYHMLFDRHQIVLANGAPSESFFPGDVSMKALAHDTREEVLSLFPELKSGLTGSFAQTARMCLTAREASLLTQRAA